ncbi:hypothetical protein ACOMHN_001123 [Nucella lapillus]
MREERKGRGTLLFVLKKTKRTQLPSLIVVGHDSSRVLRFGHCWSDPVDDAILWDDRPANLHYRGGNQGAGNDVTQSAPDSSGHVHHLRV